jgi:glycosyltransferase involved in cell wall biosynthesis
VTGRVVPARDPGAMAAALIELIASPERARAMGRAGRHRFEERFSAERMVAQTLAVYEELL